MAKAKNAASQTPAAGEQLVEQANAERRPAKGKAVREKGPEAAKEPARNVADSRPAVDEKAPAISKPSVGGRYVIDHKEIPKEILAFVGQKLGKDASVNPAREGGGYKGKVLLNSGDYLVQAVGRDGGSAVVHRKADLTMVGSNLEWRNTNERLQAVDVQIHYTGDKAKVFPWNREREDQLRFMNRAKDYAQTIKSDTERGVFLKHLERFTGQGKGSERSSEKAPARAPERMASKSKGREAGPER
jgi:putative DNA primase/helicase